MARNSGCINTSVPFPPSYSPDYVEASWYQWWEKEAFFTPEHHDRVPHAQNRTFTLCIPPPNVTGTLHLGHALTVAIEDAVVRWKRMQGYRVLWVPGCDHAGIATQSVVEKRLLREQRRRGQDLSREEFLQEVWTWKNQKGDEIYQQLRRLGASLDWSRACFTLDQGFSNAVTEAFVRLSDSGLIYRSEALVNWSCSLQTAISDIEVESKELSGRTWLSVPGYDRKVEFGTMVTFAYPLEGQDGEVAVSTTRPETMLGDVAIAGMKRFDAREKVLDALAEKTLLRDKKEHAMSLPMCSRSGDVIEPLLKKQWFLRCEDMAARAIQVVEEGQLEIIPHFYTKTWKNWLSNISDWCISRQLWWGHRIPAYQVALPGSSANQETADLQQFYPNSILETGSDILFFWVARMVMLGTELTGQLPFKQVFLHSLVRDKHGRKMSKSLGNVIDPLDIISGVSLKRLQEKVTAGNLDPRDHMIAMEALRREFPNGIPECGTDALRFALCSYRVQGEDISLSVSQVLSYRHFCNKIWQTVRFTLGVLGDGAHELDTLPEMRPVSSMDRWLCSRLYSTVLQCERGLEAYELSSVTTAIYSFWVHSLCDVYLECIKPLLSQKDLSGSTEDHVSSERRAARAVLYHCVTVPLALLAPFMPYLTEELWQRLHPLRAGGGHHAAPSSLCLQPFPRSADLEHWHSPEEETDFLLIQEVVRVTRSLRAQCGMTKERPEMWAVCSPAQRQILLRFQPAVCTLGRIATLHIHCPQGAPPTQPTTPPAEGSIVGTVDHSCQLHLNVPSGKNVDQQIFQLSQHKEKLLPKLEKWLSKTRAPGYLEKVPEHVRQEMDNKISALEKELRNIEEQLSALNGLQRDHAEL
ncbi:hypothetical protein CRUP_008317 [Coryphaenoides rupestris]|nr:hypothetical protein CRUP_008317 [Coryphaenoides rupestris]